MLATALVAAFHHGPKCTQFSPALVGRKEFGAPPCMFIDARDTIYIANIQTSLGPIRLLLDPILAPADVNNFVFLAKTGVYNDTVFTRVENNADHAFVQGGDPTGTGRGNAGYTYEGTAPSPIVRYTRGVVAVANTGTLRSNGSQFFIIAKSFKNGLQPDKSGLPKYSFIGIVQDDASFQTLDKMVSVPLDGARPAQDIKLQSVTIQTVPRDKKTQGPPSVLPTP